MNTTAVAFVDSSVTSFDTSLDASSVVPSSVVSSSVVTSSVVPSSVTYDASMISWADPYDTFDVGNKYRCHCCNNPINKKRILTFAERPYGQGSAVVHAYYFCQKNCQKNFLGVALELTNKNVNQILKIKDESGLWAIQSKFPAFSHDGLGLYVYRIKDDIIYSKIYTCITISKINESEVVGNFNEQVYVDSSTRYIDDESEEVQSCVPNDDDQSF
jgi:hypothetical protein